jgi:hypothetical protein
VLLEETKEKNVNINPTSLEFKLEGTGKRRSIFLNILVV